ncbi:MAG: Ig-like domain-containing protein, partial [Candidatus Methylacidiphilales bacterium]
GILGVNLNLQVSTSDSYGTVTQVDFYNERTLIGSSTSYPFSLPWSPHTWGTFHITAVALDDLGAVSLRSDVLTVTFPCDLDSNGLPDDWEIDKFGHVGNSGSADFDGDALTNLYEYQHGSDPTNYYSQGSVTVVPVVTIISGDGQDGGKGYFADAPLVVKVTNSSGGAALNKAPVTFTVISGGGLVFDATYNSGSAITVQTGSDGNAQVFYCQPETDNTTSTITASSAGQSVTFTESTSLGDGNFDPPTAPTVDSINSTQFALSWENHATAADFILVQERANGGAWSTIATFTDITTTNYTVTGLSPGVIYEYRIVAGQN